MSYKDDLESLGYVIINMITGTLPWRDLITSDIREELYDEMIKLRSPMILSKGIPSRF